MKKTLICSALLGVVLSSFAAEPILKLDGETVPAGAKGVKIVDGGVVGKAYKMDGTGGFEVAKNLNLGNAYSYSIWIRPEKFSGGYMHLISYPKNMLRLFSGSVSMNLNGFHTIRTGRILRLNEWQNLTVTYDNKKLKVYLNGKLVGEAEKPDAKLSNGDQVVMFYNKGRDKNSDFYIGMADEIKIYNVALTPEEVVKEATATP